MAFWKRQNYGDGIFWAAQVVRNPLVNAGDRRDEGSILGREDPLQEEMATHSSITVWRISWTNEPGGLQSIGLQRVRRDWSDLARTHGNSNNNNNNNNNQWFPGIIGEGRMDRAQRTFRAVKLPHAMQWRRMHAIINLSNATDRAPWGWTSPSTTDFDNDVSMQVHKLPQRHHLGRDVHDGDTIHFWACRGYPLGNSTFLSMLLEPKTAFKKPSLLKEPMEILFQNSDN